MLALVALIKIIFKKSDAQFAPNATRIQEPDMEQGKVGASAAKLKKAFHFIDGVGIGQ